MRIGKLNVKSLGLGVLSLVVAMLSLMFVAPAQPAAAAGCRHYDTASDWLNVAPSGPDYGTWYYADTHVTPYNSGCRDINLPRESIRSREGYIACAYFRVRFYPSSGGSYTNSPKFACTGYGTVLVATSVNNNVRYRIETNYPVRFHIFD